MTEREHINDTQLEELLKQLYLDTADTISDEAAMFAMEQEYAVTPDPAKEQALIKHLSQHKGGTWLYFTGFVLMYIFSLAASWYVWHHTGNTEPGTFTTKHSGASSETRTSPHDYELVTTHSVSMPDKNWKTPFGKMPELTRAYEDSLVDAATDTVLVEDNGDVTIASYVVPVLSETEKKNYRKVKEQMLQKLLSLDKSLYTRVPPDRVSYKGKKIILEPFTIRNLSISNLEYKTFLADLLMQGRNAVYIQAMAIPGNWAAYDAPGLGNDYLQDTRYNDFPVVNVTPLGATLFCKWFQDEAAVYALQHGLKGKSLQIRLPTDKEWIYLAWTGYAKVPYSMAYTTLFDKAEGLVGSDFPKRMEQVQRRARQKDTLYDILAVNKYGWTETAITTFMDRAFAAYSPSPADTIYPERMKLFSKYGSVSELTQKEEPGQYWLSGKIWKDRQAYLKQMEAFDRNGASPFVGFRIVVLNPADSEYKDPFW